MDQDKRLAHVAVLSAYAAHSDHPHAPEVCRKAVTELDQMDLFAEPAPEPLSPSLELEPSEPEPDPEPELALPAPAPVVDEAQTSLFGAGELQAVEAPPEPIQSIYVHFEDLADLESFGRLIGQPVTTQTRLIKFPVDPHHFKAWRELNGVE